MCIFRLHTSWGFMCVELTCLIIYFLVYVVPPQMLQYGVESVNANKCIYLVNKERV